MYAETRHRSEGVVHLFVEDRRVLSLYHCFRVSVRPCRVRVRV